MRSILGQAIPSFSLATRCVLALLAAGLPLAAAAQDAPDTRLGHSSNALPGFGRLAIPSVAPWPVAASLRGGVGITESVLDADDSHTRLSGRLAASVQPVDFISVALQFDGRYDTHSVGSESDDGLVGDPRLILRGQYDLGGASIGAQATVWIPGSDAPSLVFEATTVDLVAMAGFDVSPDFTLGLNAGFRIDQSAESAPDANRLSPSDRISLGVSDSNAVLLGAGGAFRTGPVQIYADWTWDLLIGDAAPDVGASPMRIGAGGRLWVADGDAIQLEARIEALLSSRPEVTGALAPIEPRFSAFLGATFRFPTPGVAASPDIDPDDPDRIVEADGEPGDLHGRIVDEAGEPIAGAEVTANRGDDEYGPVTTGTDGDFVMEDVPSGGPLRLTVRADGFREGEGTATIRPGEEADVSVELERDLPDAEIRGVIQSFRGDPVQATVRVEPIGEETTAEEDGTFEVDVPPGSYEVVITADGYQEQRRPVTVERQGVIILNIDLRRE
ncbi:MAG: carboxypeptidase regulatory-like domain-containing protein [Myxococcota bacterium]